MPLVKYVLLVEVTSGEHPADLLEHVRAALEGAAGVASVLKIDPIATPPPLATGDETVPPPADDDDDEEDEPKKKPAKKR